MTAAHREPNTQSAAELYARDKLLDKMLQAKSREELGKLVADNILTFDKSFWMRLALKHDESTTPEQKAALSSLATTIQRLVDAIVKASEVQTAESAQVLQGILKAAADERGEWHWPLSAASTSTLQRAVDERFKSMDEALLSNAYAWMRRCKEDGLTEVYLVLQQILQLFAAKSLVDSSGNGDRADRADASLDAVISSAPQSWEQVLQEHISQKQLAESAFMESLQRRMEGVILNEQSGSHAQNVQAQFLKELEAVAKKAFATSES